MRGDNVIESITSFFTRVYDIIMTMITSMGSTIAYLDAVNFNESFIFGYLGYVRYFMGDLNYIAFSSMLVIAVGISLWHLVLQAIGLIKNMLPW